MAASIQFYAGENNNINNLAGSGLGGFGDSGFGGSVAVGAYQGTTFIVNSLGTSAGPQADNIKFINAQSGAVNGASSGINLRAIPNQNATLEIRFTNDTAVLTQNVKAYIYDRVSINNPASGVTTKLAELAHPDVNQVNNGSGSQVYHTFSGTSLDAGHFVQLIPSPGQSGHYATGAGDKVSDTHSNYLALSFSPDSIGSKLFALYVSLEYL